MTNILNDTYDIIGEIGSGGGGTIYKAYHKRLQKEVILKKIHGSIKDVINNRTEADILKNLRHSYLPQVLDFLEFEDEVYTVMDFIQGESFEQLLNRKVHFTVNQIVKYGEQLCEAIYYLHTQKVPIIHGDIKPANIMLTPDDNICLIDFNISGVVNGEGIITVGYTRGYAAPEQARAVEAKKNLNQKTFSTLQERETEILLENKEKKGNSFPTLEMDKSYTIDNAMQIIDIRADIYSAGAFLYHLLTNMKPSTDYSQIRPIKTYSPQISEGLIAVVNKAMAYKAEERFQTADQFLYSLHSYTKLDKRYKRLLLKQKLTSILVMFGILGCIVLIYFGKNQIRIEKEARFSDYIVQLTEARENKDEENFEKIYGLCINANAKRIEPYYEKALLYYQMGNYEDGIKYIIDEVLVQSKLYEDACISDIYYILGSCYFELEDMTNAVNNYQTAIMYNDSNPDYYRDYAIALAKNNEVDRAEVALEEAKSKGILEDSIYLISGEIAFALNNEEEAIANFEKCVNTTKDNYMKFRAYVMWSKVYDTYKDSEEMLLKKLDILNDANDNLPTENQALIYEKIVQAYIDLNNLSNNSFYLQNALDALAQIVNYGWDTYNTYNNIAVINEQLGKLGDAQEVLNTMLEKYGENYNTYKRLAFVEAEQQNNLELNLRDYTRFAEYYEKAKELFKQSGKTSDSDMEMSVLEQTYNQVKAGNWLN